MIPTLFIISFLGGFFAGLLGVGGAVVLIPLMLYVPPLVGAGELSIHQVSGITMVQVLAATVAGYLAHRSSGFAHTKTMLTIGLPMGVFSLLGATASNAMRSETILLIFGCVVIFAFVLLLKKEPGEPNLESNAVPFHPLSFPAVGCAVGFVAGIVGAGGGFILIPLMMRVLKIPIRITIGSSLGILFFGALAGALGKAMTLQVPWPFLWPVIAGSIPATLLGARISRALPAALIRYTLLAVILLTLLKTWWEILAALAGGR